MTACGFMTAAAIVTGLNKAQSADTTSSSQRWRNGVRLSEGKAMFRRETTKPCRRSTSSDEEYDHRRLGPA